MPIFTPSAVISDCWGSMGDITFFHMDGRCYYKKKSRGHFSGTATQQSNLDVHRRALAAWRSLDHKTQLVWNSFAKTVISHRPPFDNTATISGQNLFVSAYHGFYTLCDEHLPTPQPFAPFPAHSLAFSGASVIGGNDLNLSFDSFFPEGEDAFRYQVLMKVQLTRPGFGKKPGLMRNFLAEQPCSSGDGTVNVIVTDYVRRSGLDLDKYQVHCRYVLLDRQTGYRNIYTPLSFLATLR